MIKLLRWFELSFCGVVALALGWAFIPEAVIFCAGLLVVAVLMAIWQALMC